MTFTKFRTQDGRPETDIYKLKPKDANSFSTHLMR